VKTIKGADEKYIVFQDEDKEVHESKAFSKYILTQINLLKGT
jgi:hypothetical protein